jgi:hypothetical protein
MNLLLDPIIKQKMVDLGIEVPNDTVLDIIWDYLCDLIGYDLSLHENTEYRKGTGTNIIYVYQRPLQEIKELTINSKPVSLERLTIENVNGILYLDGCFDKGYEVCNLQDYRVNYRFAPVTDSIRIIYDSGFTVDTFPNELLLVVQAIIANMSTLGMASNVSSYKISDISYQFATTDKIFNPMIQSILDRYR